MGRQAGFLSLSCKSAAQPWIADKKLESRESMRQPEQVYLALSHHRLWARGSQEGVFLHGKRGLGGDISEFPQPRGHHGICKHPAPTQLEMRYFLIWQSDTNHGSPMHHLMRWQRTLEHREGGWPGKKKSPLFDQSPSPAAHSPVM